MRRDKTVARVLLILSIASVVLAAPALLPQRRLVTDRADNEPTDESEQAHGVLPAAPPPSVGLPDGSEKSLSAVSGSESLLDMMLEQLLGEHQSAISKVHQDSDPVSGASKVHQDLVPVSGASESHSDVPPVSGDPGHDAPISRPWWLVRPPARSEVGVSPSQMQSGKPGVKELPPASEAQPLHDLANWEDWPDWGSDVSDGFVSSVDDMHFHRSFE